MDERFQEFSLTRPWRDGGRDAIGHYTISTGGKANYPLKIDCALETDSAMRVLFASAFTVISSASADTGVKAVKPESITADNEAASNFLIVIVHLPFYRCFYYYNTIFS